MPVLLVMSVLLTAGRRRSRCASDSDSERRTKPIKGAGAARHGPARHSRHDHVNVGPSPCFDQGCPFEKMFVKGLMTKMDWGDISLHQVTPSCSQLNFYNCKSFSAFSNSFNSRSLVLMK